MNKCASSRHILLYYHYFFLIIRSIIFFNFYFQSDVHRGRQRVHCSSGDKKAAAIIGSDFSTN